MGAGGDWVPCCLLGAGVLPGVSVMALSAVPWLLNSLVSGGSLMLLVALRFGLLGAALLSSHCSGVRWVCFLLFPAALGPNSVLPFCVVSPRS